MGLVETLLEHVSIRSVSIFFIAYLSIRTIISRVGEHRRIKRLGSYAPVMHSYVPFGLDFVYRGIRAIVRRKYLEHWRDNFFLAHNAWTVEARVTDRRIIYTADPENIKALLQTQFQDFGKGERLQKDWEEFLGNGIFTSDGQQWHNSRQLMRPQFTRDRVSDLHCFESHVQILFKCIANGGPLDGENQVVDLAAANGRVLDIAELFYRYSLDIATEFLLGHDVKTLSTHKEEFAEALAEAQRIQYLLIPANKLRPYIPKPGFHASLKVINDYINHFIQLALNLSPEELAASTKSDKNYTFLHEIANHTRDPKVLRDEILAVLLAGRDTTACALAWTMYELARHPRVVARLRKEILQTIGHNGLPTYDDLKNMSYLKAVINESLRIYPVAPFSVRVAMRDTTLPRGGGPDGTQPVAVPKDSPVAFSSLVMQRRTDLYPPISEKFADPAVFSPERWSVWQPRPHEYIPFSSGPRICIGQQFALTEMSYTLCRIFQRFERVESFMHEIDGGNPSLKTDMVLSPGDGVRVAFWEPKEKS